VAEPENAQIGPLFGISRTPPRTGWSAPSLRSWHWPRSVVRRTDQIAILERTLVALRDQQPAAESKNYRRSASLQVAIDTRPVIVRQTSARQPQRLHRLP